VGGRTGRESSGSKVKVQAKEHELFTCVTRHIHICDMNRSEVLSASEHICLLHHAEIDCNRLQQTAAHCNKSTYSISADKSALSTIQLIC